MTSRLSLFFTIVAAMLSSHMAVADVVVQKDPDLGPFWQPLDPDTGSYVYANSFVAEETGTVNELGMWLLALDGDGTGGQISFNVYGGGLAGPDSTDVIASTGLLDIGGGTSSLDLYNAATAFSGTLTVNETYWFGASIIGSPLNVGPYQVGGHTQNSQQNDNGTFWFSNDPNGVNFDGQNFTPEMAFRVSTTNVIPEPATCGLLGLGLVVFLGRRRR